MLERSPRVTRGQVQSRDGTCGRYRESHFPARWSFPTMRVLVLGGDGFCGWPTSLYLSDRGHDVTILDNLSRRKIDVDLEVESLTPIKPIGERLRAWKEVSGRDIDFESLDIATEYDRLAEVLRETQPEAIVHFAEQRAAPYSMRTSATKRYTVDNNTGPPPTRRAPRVRPASTRLWPTWAPWGSTATA